MKKYHQDHDMDDPRTTLAHREILLNKPFLKRLYREWYMRFKKESESVAKDGIFLEIGSGGGFLKDVFPSALTTDILDLPVVDRVCNAEELPFDNESVASIMMLNVFHHIPRPYLFLKEAERTLVTGGKIVMTEPANSILSRFIYKRFHHEPFDPDGAMEIDPGNPLSNSNQALPYIYFERERALFEKEYPSLMIRSIRYHTPFLYAVSGGFSKEAMLPGSFYGFVKFAEWLVSPFSRQLGLFCEIVIEKTDK